MSIIRELARDSVKTDRKASFAVSVSIFIAVVLVGFFLIIFSVIDYGQVEYMTETTGGYSAMLLAISPEDMAELKADHRVRSLAVIEREELKDASSKASRKTRSTISMLVYTITNGLSSYLEGTRKMPMSSWFQNSS
jgi:hypothetical protein